MKLTLNGGQLPPFMKISLFCNADFKDKEANIDFQTMWSEKTKSALILIKEETVEFLDKRILECNDALKATRMKAIQNIGKG